MCKDSLPEFISDELQLSLTDNAVEMSEKKSKKVANAQQVPRFIKKSLHSIQKKVFIFKFNKF